LDGDVIIGFVRVLSYNIWNGGGDRLDEIAAVIRAVAPDAVALQEATVDSAGALAEALAMELIFGEGNSIFDLHVAWLTAARVRGTANHRLPSLSKSLLEIDTGGLRLFTTHLASRHEDDVYPRDGEVAAILDVLGGVAEPHLLAGDLNALQTDDPVGTPPLGVQPRGDALPGARRTVLGPFASGGYVDCFRRVHPREPGYTYEAWAPWLRLDYVFASPSLAARLRRCEVVDGTLAASASDHLPVVAEFV
jgi:exodeoxyribonuclease III